MPCLTCLGGRDAPDASLKIEVRPLGIQDLAFSSASQDQHRHDELEHRVFALTYGVVEPSGFILAQVALFFIVHRHQGDASTGVSLDAWHFPSKG